MKVYFQESTLVKYPKNADAAFGRGEEGYHGLKAILQLCTPFYRHRALAPIKDPFNTFQPDKAAVWTHLNV